MGSVRQVLIAVISVVVEVQVLESHLDARVDGRLLVELE